MGTSFEQWEKDPFFPAAEEVQQSADRLQAVYRRWTNEGKDHWRSNPAAGSNIDLRRELQTALGTAKWQLEELEMAVRSNDDACLAGEDTRARHIQFISALGSQISKVENSLMQPSRDDRETRLAWVHLNEGERDELAHFLSVPPPLPEQAAPKGEQNAGAVSRSEVNEERVKRHRRIASADTSGSWKISLAPEDSPSRSPKESTGLSISRMSSFTSLMKALEPTSKIKLPNNSFGKWKSNDHHECEELIPLKNHQPSRGINSCCEKKKCRLGGSRDEYYDERIYGWLGAFHRQIQRSQYRIQYGRPMQILLFVVSVLLLLGEFCSVRIFSVQHLKIEIHLKNVISSNSWWPFDKHAAMTVKQSFISR